MSVTHQERRPGNTGIFNLTSSFRSSLWKPLLSALHDASAKCARRPAHADHVSRREEPASGLLITFVQFIITALFTWPSHFAADRPPFFVKDRAVPLIRWLPNILMFFAVNMLNNFAFGYNISVPVHIILRSGGSVMTMAVGYLWGKSYSKVQGMITLPNQDNISE